MAKDPAFLFYHKDFLIGTTFMSFEERGAYITLLCYLADKGSISKQEILKIIPLPIWESICCKFKEVDGVFFNERLRAEVDKRRNFTESRRKNLHMVRHMVKHMNPHMVNGNVNGNVNKDVIKDKDGSADNIKEIISNLNATCGTRYKDSTPETIKAIKTLLDRGFTVEDFKNVHLKKYIEWGNDPEWSKFLRPSTLYQPKKFEAYLNQRPEEDHRPSNLTKAQQANARRMKEFLHGEENASRGDGVVVKSLPLNHS